MKIVIVCDLLSTFYRFRRFLAIELRNRNHDVLVLAGTDDLQDKSYFAEHSIELEIVSMERTGLNLFNDWKYCGNLKQVFRRYQPDHILAYQAKAAVWAAIAAKSLPQCDVTILFPGLGFLFAANPRPKQRLIQMASRPLYRYAFKTINNTIFQNSDDIATMREAKILAQNTNVALVNGSGVNLSEFEFCPAPIDPIRFVMATRLLADKGVREFAEAAGQLIQENPDACVEFHLAGGFDTNPTAIKEQEVRAWESKGWVKYHGYVDDMIQFLKDSSVFVLPSYYMEGTPRSILEALSTGRPIITTDNRGCKETIQEGINGYIVPQRDVKSLKRAMERFIQNPGLIAEFGTASREMAEHKYDVDLVNQKMIEVMGL